MSHLRRAARVDNNQKQIVKDLRGIHGLSVALGHDDILVGWRNQTFWYEIKNPSRIKKDGNLQKGAKQESQIKLDNEWSGHYKIVSTTDEILKDLGIL